MQTQDQVQAKFIEAYDLYADDIFRHCYYRVFDRAKALDLMQETFLKVWEYIESGKELQQIRPFLYTTANHLTIDFIRQQKRRNEESLESLELKGIEFESQGQSNDYNLNNELLQTVLHQIQEPYRSAVMMRYIDGMKPREIASILRESVNVISVRINRGMEKLKLLAKNYE